jgi:putative FmdB family regulatory protein
MPTYDYTCEACRADWQLEQRMTENAVTVCPKCNEPKAKRLISGGNFMLKGDGWYKDLYHKPSSRPSAGDSNGSSESKSSESKSSESKSSESKSSESKTSSSSD